MKFEVGALFITVQTTSISNTCLPNTYFLANMKIEVWGKSTAQ